jgi:hypothetical protein
MNLEQLMIPIRDTIQSLNIPISRIWNWDETGLFYRSMPTYTLARASDTGAGEKHQKNRITLMPIVNSDGSERKLVVIRKSKSPKGTSPEFRENHGIKYFYNKKAWMNFSIFLDILKSFESKINEPTILILDNFSSHVKDLDLLDFQHLIPIFLPPNTTSSTQPLDGGIIASFKLFYRSQLLDYVCRRMENDMEMESQMASYLEARVQ